MNRGDPLWGRHQHVDVEIWRFGLKFPYSSGHVGPYFSPIGQHQDSFDFPKPFYMVVQLPYLALVVMAMSWFVRAHSETT